ncbi:hypothetical protein [Micromonospora zamorensis]|uniref:hypothetical protein n=1 Tax=Micromonospora zamorensis TaxID=709883 RepID=UPI002ED12845|nr:hypothetical protein OG886_31245 [Micromonospora zamorensis]
MDTLERNLLWLGIEDYTGLWDAVAEARGDGEPRSTHDALVQARRAIEFMLAADFAELFRCPEPLNNDTVELVSAEEQSAILNAGSSWVVPEEGGTSIRFATTDRGFAAYQKETGWPAD